MSHHWWFRVYVALVLGTFGMTWAAVRKALREAWNAQCACCDEPLEEYRRVYVCALIVGIYATRSLFWFIAIPLEFSWLLWRYRDMVKEKSDDTEKM